MNLLNRQHQGLTDRKPIRIVQFGEGNFLRAFVDYAFNELNSKCDFNAGVAVVQPIDKGLVNMLNAQDGLYTHFSKGVVHGEEIQKKTLVDCIVKALNPYEDFQAFTLLAHEPLLEFIISNTTEAGIAYDSDDTLDMAPPNSFPGKLTVLLYERFLHFEGDESKGLTIIPCELINHNADTLKKIIHQYIELWHLGTDFKSWIDSASSFHNTLVDRIVPGYPKDEIEDYNKQLDYKDNLIVTSEIFFLWVIEGNGKLKEKLPFDKLDLDVKVVADMQPYRTRKVRILNGAHTAMVPFSLLYGNETVKQTVDDDFTGKFVRNTIFNEIIPTLDMDTSELVEFANAVLDRFRNPFIKHYLSSIALNSVSKFKVRVLPSILAYHENTQKIPLYLTFAFACLLRFYKGVWKGTPLPVNDDETVINTIQNTWKENNTKGFVQKIMAKDEFWGQDLTAIEGFDQAIVLALDLIESSGIEEGFNQFLNQTKTN